MQKEHRNEESTCCNTLHPQLQIFIPVLYYLEGIFIFKVFTGYLTDTTPRNWKKFLYLRFLHHSKTAETLKCASVLSGLKQ